MRVNPQFFRRGYLKKQSQFSKGQNDIKTVLLMVYGDFDGPRRQKNKANSKPNKANLFVHRSAFSVRRGGFVIPV